MDWFILIIAGILEIVWAVGLKYSNGFTQTIPTVVTIITSCASFFLLAIAMRTIPLGTAYAVWTGIGVCGTVIFGILYFNESKDLLKIACIFAILASIFTLKVLAK